MIEVTGLTKRFGEKLALADVSIIAADGEVTGFVGPNGAGKSTLMKILLGLVPADSGTAWVDGAPYVRSHAPVASVGAMISAEWLPPRLTAEALIAYACETHGIDRARVGEVIAMVGLASASKQRIGSYSLGMRQRLGIGLALVGDPRNLVLDEPINGLDPNGVLWLRSFLRSRAEAGTAVFLSSHLMSELELVADRVVMLSGGRVVRQGTMAELGSGQTPRVYLESPGIDGLIGLLERRGFVVERHGPGAYVQNAEPLEVGRIAFESGAGVSHLSVARESLEDVFLMSTQAEYQAQEGAAS